MMTTGKIRIVGRRVQNMLWSYFRIPDAKMIDEDRNDSTKYNDEQSLNDVILLKLVEYILDRHGDEHPNGIRIPETAENQYWLIIRKTDDGIIVEVQEPAA